MDRRTMLRGAAVALVLGRCVNAMAAADDRKPFAPSPADIGTRVAQAYLRRPDLMMYQVEPVVAVHYADVASAYGAMRLARATGDAALMAQVRARHARLAAEAIPNSANHVDANVAGVWDFEMARAFGDDAALKSGIAFADGQWDRLGADGLTSQARYWIDDVWMIGMLQVAAWRVTREPRFLDRAARMARAYLDRLQQPNGLFHHGPDAPFYWGRGNGWVAAGLAEILSELPERHADFPAIRNGYRRMMTALLKMQRSDGLWGQLIDRPEAWGETSGTAMFAFALAAGVRRGLLEGTAWTDAVRRAWTALTGHLEPDGQLRDICVGTGQSKDAAYYLARPRTTGDLHGQAAMLWLAAALAQWEKAA